MATIEQLYKSFGVLADAKDKAGEHESEYLVILSGVKGGVSEKRLSSQFIARFFKHFPTLAEQAIDAQLDLCEDDEVAIRKQAIKDLPSFCKDTPEHLPKLADVLTQLLQSEDAHESSLVQSSLITLFGMDVKGCISGIFTQILQGDDIIREKALKFLAAKLKTLPEDVWKPDVEEAFVEQIKKTLEDVTGDEFVLLMKLLSGLKCMTTMQGRQQLVEIVCEQADLDSAFVPSDPDCVDRLMQCIKQAMPYFSKNVHSTRFLVYMCDQVLPVLSEVQCVEEEGQGDNKQPSVDLQLELLKLFAEMSTNAGEVEDTPARVAKVYTCLLSYMPLPPTEEETESEDAQPKLQFSYVECLMYAFHQLARKAPDFLTGEDNADKLKDFKIRLQYFARGVQVYIKQLRMALQGKSPEVLKTDENKIKVAALKITNNINTLIKDLFHNPPSYKATINLSWRPVVSKPVTTITSPGDKRRSSQSEDSSGPKKARGAVAGGKLYSDQPRYAPPSGKFSEKVRPYSDNGRGRGGFRGRGRGRGGGGNFRRFNRY